MGMACVCVCQPAHGPAARQAATHHTQGSLPARDYVAMAEGVNCDMAMDMASGGPLERQLSERPHR